MPLSHLKRASTSAHRPGLSSKANALAATGNCVIGASAHIVTPFTTRVEVSREVVPFPAPRDGLDRRARRSRVQRQEPGKERKACGRRNQEPGRPILLQPQVRQVAANDLGQGGDDEEKQGLEHFHAGF